MRVAVCTIVYNEDAFIGAVVNNWKGKVAKHLVLSSSIPWHGMSLHADKTNEIAQKLGAEVISRQWSSETSQRNWGLGYLADFDYVLAVDSDELYEESDQLKILESLGQNAGEFRVENTNCYRVPSVVTYFKTPGFVIEPPDTHEPLIAINPRVSVFKDCRLPSQQYVIPIPGVKMHHLTYLREDIRLWHKLHQFEHFDQVRRDWFESVWKKWTPEMVNVRNMGYELARAVPGVMPDEILTLLSESLALTAHGKA